MNIALLGYGRMGKEIEKIARQRNHEIPLIIDVDNTTDLNQKNLAKIDVAIDFSLPSAAFNNVKTCFEAGTPIVCGTTGWHDRFEEIKIICKETRQAFFYASNFSLGVNLFLAANQRLAELMNDHPQYNVDIIETHHTRKLDAPSGTAITLAETIMSGLERKNNWVLDGSKNDPNLNIHAIREGDVFGIHTTTWESEVDFIKLTHSAKSRKGFAFGAVMAAEFLNGKKGVFSMKDLLNL